MLRESLVRPGPAITFVGPIRRFLADCLPTPFTYSPLSPGEWHAASRTTTTRSMGASGTGNGDSFLRASAVRTVAAMARWKPEPAAKSLTQVAGPGGELQRTAGDRWGKTGEGEGGMIDWSVQSCGTRADVLSRHDLRF